MVYVGFKGLISFLLFFILGLMAYGVVQRFTESNFKESDNSLAAERKRLIKYIICFLLPIWIVYVLYLLCRYDLSWVESLFTNFFTAAVVLLFQEMKQQDNKDCGLWCYGVFGVLLLAGWIVINLLGTNIYITDAYEKFGVPMGVGLFIWVVNDGLKKFLKIGSS